MKYKDRQGNILEDDKIQESIVRFLYGTYPGEGLLKILTHKGISKLAGTLLSTKMSTALIPYFVRRNNIKVREYDMSGHRSFNDFFARRLSVGARNVELNPDLLISPADSKVMVYNCDENAEFTIKGLKYIFAELTQSKKLAEVFKGGQLLVFRLSVDDYHRYCYVDSGDKSQNYRIPGILHTVNPVACENTHVYRENERVISMLKSENFGLIMMMEVGAMMVGKIINYEGPTYVRKGKEKGRFEFGGSTIIIALRKGAAEIDHDILLNSQQGLETKVKYGERIGRKV
ncbi:MAG: phosphatidylserine decarboxylase [Clostridiales bacterium]|nr:phosphatidylserine decarboxylase [Clostridiales bacterium]MDY6117223.1 phosphatidylserine decarboxylase [Anaerovoracaceae bacterium]